MGEMDAYKDIFMSESAEFVQAITEGLLALETNAGDLEPVEVIFRGAHSLKGMSATMGYERTADLTHRMETLMDRVRKRELAVDSRLIDLMLEAVDTVRVLIEDESEGRSDVDTGPMIERILAMAEGEATADGPAAAPGAAPRKRTARRKPTAVKAPIGGQSDDELDEVPGVPMRPEVGSETARTYRVTVTLEEACVLKAVRAYMVIKRLTHMGEVLETIPEARDIEDERFDREFVVVVRTSATAESVQKATLGVSEIEKAVAEVTAEAAGTAKTAGGALSGQASRPAIPKLSETQTVRIAIGHLDSMVNLVGEFVILRSRLERVARDLKDRELDDTLEELHRVSSELQHEVMHTRMVPVGNIFNRFPRMVRDLARDLGKDIAFEMDGLDIELDRTVLDEIGDPIVHLLRNSVDHGIGDPATREAGGKPARGTVRLTAARERDQVRITVSDDGRGIDVERIWDKACSLNVVEPEAREAYRDEEILLLTCMPGFSTAENATRVSGRGVGMDVVKGKIEHLGGSLTISSAPGLGTETVLTLPLTLAIIQALMIGAAGRTFAIPLSSVDEVFSPQDAAIDTVDGAPVIVMRDHSIVPVFRVDALLGLGGVASRLPDDAEHLVLVEDAVGHRRALVVEKLYGRHEIVVKPISRMFRDAKGIGGATVLGDGRVALIIDPRTIFPMREESR
ncbi:MAG: chemotaxis protein CheA [Actinomycetota bacterium]|nr:chemotaxis protein CheA [Actinomycetota bacterium]